MKKRILLAEDDPLLLEATAARLESDGFEVVTAVNGEDALRKILREPAFGLLLLDVKMPRMDGLEVCERVKGNPETAGIPIILFTGSVGRWQSLADDCIRLGVSDWLRKPFRTGELLDKVHQALEKKNGNG